MRESIVTQGTTLSLSLPRRRTVYYNDRRSFGTLKLLDDIGLERIYSLGHIVLGRETTGKVLY